MCQKQTLFPNYGTNPIFIVMLDPICPTTLSITGTTDASTLFVWEGIENMKCTNIVQQVFLLVRDIVGSNPIRDLLDKLHYNK